MNKLRSTLFLLLTAFIWGNAFAAQSAGMDHIGPWTFCCLRYLIGALTLWILMPVLDRIRGIRKSDTDSKGRMRLIRSGILCGIVLFAASIAQQIGIRTTPVGKAGFLTALYVVIVPLLAMLSGKKTDIRIWIAAIIALCGFWFLSLADSLQISSGDTLLLICSLLFACHIIVIDRYAEGLDGVRLSCIQFCTAGIIGLGPMIVLEGIALKDIAAAAMPLLYAGVLSSGAGYTLQILGQKDADPSAAGLILSLESVFAVLAGYIFLHQILSVRELFGCALVFAAVVIAQLADQNQ